MNATSSFMGCLARDTRGNTIAIMAASLVPMLGLAGSAVDMSRLYVVKVRLQQACDAGVLAGRKFMTGTTLDAAAETQARSFFTNNFQNGWMKTSNTQFTPVRTNAAQVSGVARTQVPMTIMKFFGFPDKSLTVDCQARYDVADTDVLFVLDTTGSMACLPSQTDAQCSAYVNAAGTNSYTRPSDSSIQKSVGGYPGTNAYAVPENSSGSEVSRIEAVRRAVISFYQTFASVKDASTKVRYGFVTYASSVNAGRAIRDVVPSALIGASAGDNPTYQSREVKEDYTISTSDKYNNGLASTKASCESLPKPPRVPSAAKTYDTGTGNAKQDSYYWDSTNKCVTRTSTLGPVWEYKPIAYNVSNAVAGGTMTNPTKLRGQQMRWLGCVETPVETPGQTSFSSTNPPDEIDPDITPSGASRWIPHMQDLVYRRNSSYYNAAVDTTNGDDWNVAPGYGSDQYATKITSGSRVTADAEDMQQGGFVACGKPVKRLSEMTEAEVTSWVKSPDFAPLGGTYHDTGMIWGARLLSPTGPWAADTQPWVFGRNLNRVIIFFTDGDMSPSTSSYSMYGLEGYDRKVSGTTFGNNDPGSGKNGDGTCTNTSANCYKYMTLHNQRFLAACAAASAKSIDIFTVAIDSASSPQLTACATNPSQAQFTTNGATLKAMFEGIARKLAMLRLVPA